MTSVQYVPFATRSKAISLHKVEKYRKISCNKVNVTDQNKQFK